jgi:hypothetical protein
MWLGRARAAGLARDDIAALVAATMRDAAADAKDGAARGTPSRPSRWADATGGPGRAQSARCRSPQAWWLAWWVPTELAKAHSLGDSWSQMSRSPPNRVASSGRAATLSVVGTSSRGGLGPSPLRFLKRQISV